jgi:hypothetical protein
LEKIRGWKRKKKKKKRKKKKKSRVGAIEKKKYDNTRRLPQRGFALLG